MDETVIRIPLPVSELSAMRPGLVVFTAVLVSHLVHASSPPAARDFEPALEAAPVDASTPSLPARFVWTGPCRVPAVQRVVQDGKDLLVRIDLVLTPMPGWVHRLTIESMRYAGSDPGSEEARGVELAARLLSPLSSIISSSGEIMATEGVEESIRRTHEVVSLPPGFTAEQRAAFESNAKEGARDQFELQWASWINLWIDVDFAPDEHAVAPLTDDPEDGTTTFRHLGSVQGRPDLVLLSYEIRELGPLLARMFVESGGALIIGGGDKVLEELKQARRVQVFTVAFDPIRARPWRARHERRQEHSSGTKVSFTDTTFDWARAVGCDTTVLK